MRRSTVLMVVAFLGFATLLRSIHPRPDHVQPRRIHGQSPRAADDHDDDKTTTTTPPPTTTTTTHPSSTTTTTRPVEAGHDHHDQGVDHDHHDQGRGDHDHVARRCDDDDSRSLSPAHWPCHRARAARSWVRWRP